MIEVNYNEYKETIAQNMKLIVENHDLKQEIERLNKELEEKEAILGGIQQLEAEIERLNKENELLKSNPNFVYAMRNHKAIEYIEEETENINNLIVVSEDFDIEKVLDILKGVDKE